MLLQLVIIDDDFLKKRLYHETSYVYFKCYFSSVLNLFFVKCLVMPWKFPLIVNLDFKAYPSRHTLYFRRRVTDIRNIQVAEKEFSDVRPKTAPARKAVRPRSPVKPTKCVNYG